MRIHYKRPIGPRTVIGNAILLPRTKEQEEVATEYIFKRWAGVLARLAE